MVDVGEVMADNASDDLKGVSHDLIGMVCGELEVRTAAKAISATRRMIDTSREMTGMMKSCQVKRGCSDQ